MLLSYPSKALHKRPVYAGCLFRAACRANDAFYIRHLRCLSVYKVMMTRFSLLRQYDRRWFPQAFPSGFRIPE
jgi:hypothetical protein